MVARLRRLNWAISFGSPTEARPGFWKVCIGPPFGVAYVGKREDPEEAFWEVYMFITTKMADCTDF